MHIPMSRPSLGTSEMELVAEVLDSGWLGEGEYTERFEKSVASLVQATVMVAVNTGTSALHLSLEALGIGPDDEVILPSLTYAADAMAVRMCGAKPLFCEIDPTTLNLDPGHMASLTGDRCRASTRFRSTGSTAGASNSICAISITAMKRNPRTSRPHWPPLTSPFSPATS